MTFIDGTDASSPVFDYSSRDYASVFADLVQRIPLYLPEWTSQSNNDFGIVLLQMFAYVCDLLGYYEDRLAGEAFIQTATQPVSIINLASMLDYQPTLSVGSTVLLQITISPNVNGPIVIPAGSIFSTQASTSQASIPFATNVPLTIAGANAATPSLTGIVAATQGVTHAGEQVASSDGTPNQAYPLLFNPVSADGFVVSVDLGLGPQPWTYVQSLINSGPFDQVYTNFVDSNGIFYVIFGDGVNGLVPSLGSPITCTYQTNVGSVGNVGAGTISSSNQAIIGLSQVSNPLPATGGAPAESLASIRQAAPASLKTLNRAVTVSDVETLAEQVSGVNWASSQQVTYQLVNLFIAPFGGGAPSALLQDAVLNYVVPLTMANTTVSVFPPTYVPIDISTNVVAFSNFGNTAVQTAVQQALASLLTVANTGFGFRVGLGLIYSTILDVAGVNYAIVTQVRREMLATLTTALASGTPVTSLAVSALPQAVAQGDSITITNTDSPELTTALVAGNVYTTLSVQALTQAVANGDQLLVNSGGNPVQTAVASALANVGAVLIHINSFTAGVNYPIGTPVEDITSVNNTQAAVVASPGAAAGATAVPINSITPAAAYPIGSTIEDNTFVGDAVLLENEIPEAGTFTVNVTGGFIGS